MKKSVYIRFGGKVRFSIKISNRGLRNKSLVIAMKHQKSHSKKPTRLGIIKGILWFKTCGGAIEENLERYVLRICTKLV